jgi:ABC-type branched-subunit amino acid transport system ATPase component
MLRTLVIDNFRAFEHLELSGLGRINLLVGKNNCGKTSVLEAIYLLAAREARALATISLQRGELIGADLDIRQLFHGRVIESGAQFTIRGEGAEPLIARVLRDPPDRHRTIDDPSGDLTLELDWGGSGSMLSLSASGSIKMKGSRADHRPFDEAYRGRVKLLTSEALDGDSAAKLLDAIILTTEEPRLIEALKIVDLSVERIATVSFSRAAQDGHGGIFIRCTGTDQRIPVGNMGDGIWRLLGIALSLIASQDGILLIDEIDTGLHHSVMKGMWKLVRDTAERLNVQVFATTHSDDCTEAIAAIAREDVNEGSEVTIQRIEKGKPRAVAFTEREITIVAEDGLEVR